MNLINKLDNTKPIHLYFGRHYENLKITPEITQWIDNLPHRIVMCRGWSELPDLLKLNPAAICFSSDELGYTTALDIVNMVRTMNQLVGTDMQIPIAVDVGLDTNYADIKLLQKSGIFGIIPRACDFSLAECEKGVLALWAKIPYWPRHIIEQLSGYYKKSVELKPSSQEKIQITVRQQQILNLVVERGVSNKIIARTLNISESTVKLHLSNIFKKYGVKNRTQLALFAQHNQLVNKSKV